jgi:hypothetical protein
MGNYNHRYSYPTENYEQYEKMDSRLHTKLRQPLQ